MNHDEDAMSAYLAQAGEEPSPIPVSRDPRNPAEDEMTKETYHEEQKK